MMLEALAADAAKAAHLEVMVLVDATRPMTLPPEVRRIAVEPGNDSTALACAARDADWTLVVAPESDGILLDRVLVARAAGGRVLAPDDRTIEMATCKQSTIDALAARGLPVPAGRSLTACEPIPAGFHLPAVRKAQTGCGCESLEIIRARTCRPATVPTRLEALANGIPLGMSLLCGPQTSIVLPVMQQRFTAGDAPCYLGSDLLRDEAAAARAMTLALQAAAAMNAKAGWLGVDLILGERADGRDDRVLEINPRVTTSIVGQVGLFAASLVAAMIEAAAGRIATLEPVAAPGDAAGGFRLARL